MYKPDSVKMQPPSLPSCSRHNSDPYTHMCLTPNCPERLLCETCVADDHNKKHNADIHKINEYLKILKVEESGQSSKTTDLIKVVEALVQEEVKITERIQEQQRKKEHEILNTFDDLKYDLSQVIDLAYQKYVSEYRNYSDEKRIKITQEFENVKQLSKFCSIVEEGTIPTSMEQTELDDLINSIANSYKESSSLTASLQKEFDTLNRLIKKEQDTQHISTFNYKQYEATKQQITEFILERFEIQKEYQAKNNDSRKTESRDSHAKGSYSGHEGEICALAVLSADQVATAGADRIIKLWDLKTGDCFGEIQAHKDTIWDLFSAFEGRYLFSASEDKDIKVWKVSECRLKKVLSAHKSPVLALSFNEDSKLLASGSKDGALLLWNIDEKKAYRELAGHTRAIRAIKQLKSDLIVSGGDDGSIKIWSLSGLNLINTINATEASVTCLCVFSKGKRILTGDTEGNLCIWNADSTAQVSKIRAHKNGVWSAAVSEDGSLIASGGGDRNLNVWDIKTSSLLKQVKENDSVIHCVEFVGECSAFYCDLNVKKYKFSKW